MIFVSEKLSTTMRYFSITLMALIVSSFLLTGCLTGKKMDRFVEQQYGEVPKPKKKAANVIITSSLITGDDKISTSKAKTCQVIPAIFYNQWNFKNTCSLNPQIPVNSFISTVQNLVNKDLNHLISGQVLSLNVESIPNAFSVEDKNYIIFFGLYVSWNKFTIKTEKADLVVSYKLTKDGVETKKGTIRIPYVEDKQKIGLFKGWKRAVADYLDDYNSYIAQISNSFVRKLAEAL